jgi:hypothetical protein
MGQRACQKTASLVQGLAAKMHTNPTASGLILTYSTMFWSINLPEYPYFLWNPLRLQ